jgi:hypothetical protein
VTEYQLLVLSNAIEGKETGFNDWYDQAHIADVLKIPGFVSAQRFRISGNPVKADFVWRYAALYKMQTDDPEAVIKEMLTRGGTPAMPLSDALDPNLYVVLYEPIRAASTKEY